MNSLFSTQCKANVSIADVDRHYYQSHTLTLTQQTTENTLQNMMRIVAYVYHANEALTIRKQHWYFDQPELIEQTFDSRIKLWIDFGEPEIERVKKACKLSTKVIIYNNNYSNDSWWKSNQYKLNQFGNLSIYRINTKNLEKLNDRNMSLRCTLFKGDLSINDGQHHLRIERQRVM